jgi:hypothetical protein
MSTYRRPKCDTRSGRHAWKRKNIGDPRNPGVLGGDGGRLAIVDECRRCGYVRVEERKSARDPYVVTYEDA